MRNNEDIDISMDGFDPADIPGSRRVSNPAARPSAEPRQTKRRQAPQPARADAARPRPKHRSIGVIEFFKDLRTQRAIGVILVVAAAILLVATISHLRGGAADQSAIDGRTVARMAAEGVKVENAVGPAGATVSHWLFADGLGVGAFALVVWLGLLGAALLRFVKVGFWSLTAKCLFTAIALSMIFGLLFYSSESSVNWGGVHGHFANEWLISIGTIVLAAGVSVALAGVLVCVYFNELASGYETVRGTVARRREAWRSAREAERARHAELTPIHEEADEADEPREPKSEVRRPVAAPQAEGFDIDNTDELDESGEFAPRTRSLDLPEQFPADHNDSNEFNDSSDTRESLTEAEFVVHQAPTDEEEDAFPIDTDAPAEEESQPVDRFQAAINAEPYDPRAELSRFRFPDVDLLIERDSAPVIDMDEQRANKELIVKTLLDFKIPIERIEATVGPTVTLYEVKPAEGVRIAQIKRLEDDIALSLAAKGIRIIAPIPGKDVVGLEVPNRSPQIVSIRNVLNSRKFRESKMALPMALGATISNEIFVADLAKMPHLLVAGATGQGKSVGLNCILASLLYKLHPAELKLVLIDPKMVEFSLYSKIERHYLAKLPEEPDAIVTDPMKAAATLHSLCIEMDNRYQLLKQAGVRNIEEYNEKYKSHRLNPDHGHAFMPYIVMVVDEFADLVMTAGKEVSQNIARIAQKARAVGMHMIIATQRPSTDVINGMIKNNFPGRIAFKVSAMVDSRTILDSPGANRLIGRGDMLFMHNSVMTRVQCALIETSEVEAIVEHINDQIGFSEPYLLPDVPAEGGDAAAGGMVDLSHRDAMFDQCARFIVQQPTASTSILQRRFGIGYNKAGKIMDQMEAAGIVGPNNGQKPRAVLVDSITLEEIINSL